LVAKKIESDENVLADDLAKSTQKFYLE